MRQADAPEPSLTMALVLTGRVLGERLDARLAEQGLSRRLFGALGHLGTDPAQSPSDLARRARVTAQSMHATIDGLEARGFVVRTREGRGRRSSITVTAKGHAALGACRDEVERLDRALAETLSEPRYHTLRDSVGRLLTAAAQQPHGPGDDGRHDYPGHA